MPPSTRPTHDPFTTSSTSAALSTAPTLRHQVSGQSLHSNASSASTRQQQPRAPRSRRVESDVLADTESEQEVTSSITRRQRPQLRKLRHGSPARTKLKPQADEQDIVNRGPDGRYFLNGTISDMPSMTDGYEQQAQDLYYADLARKYFTSGAHQSSRTSRQAEDDFERELPEMAMRLRDEVMLKLENERWLYEPLERFRPA